MKVKINDKLFRIKTLPTEALRKQGLKGIKNMPKDAGVILDFQGKVKVPITMEGMQIPIDIIFILEGKVIAVRKAKLGDKDVTIEPSFDKVLEVNSGQSDGIKRGAVVESVGEVKADGKIEYQEGGKMESESDVHVLDHKGNVQMTAKGDERIFSRIHTRQIIKLANKAHTSGEDKDYAALGRALVRILNKHATQKEEFVEP